MQEAKNPFV